IHQPVEVHPGVDLHPLQRIERRPGHHLVPELVVAPGNHPGDPAVEQRLELGERHAASSSTAFSKARAFSASASTSCSGGMWSSHATSVLTRPKRRTASRYSAHTGSGTGASWVSRRCVPRSWCPARWNCPTRSTGIPRRNSPASKPWLVALTKTLFT